MLKATNSYTLTDREITILLAHAIQLYEQHLAGGGSKQQAQNAALEEMQRRGFLTYLPSR
jgi:hypothetical protein